MILAALLDFIFDISHICFYYIFFSQRGHSALQVWGISVWASCDPLVEDAEKEAFRAHVEALFADVL